MLPFKIKNILRFKSWGILIISLLILFFLSLRSFDMWSSRHQFDREITDLKRQIIDLKRENENLITLMESWETDSRLELEARTKLGLKKPGEEVVVVAREEIGGNWSETPISELINDQISAKESFLNNFKKWWHYFANPGGQ